MLLTIEKIGGFNVFEWEAMKCPLCEGNKFTSQDHSAVWCDECNAKFQTRHTAGDPGVVIDCWVSTKESAYVYAPSYECKECQVSRGLFDWQDKTCPANMNHEMVRRERCSERWLVPDNMKCKDTGETRFCLVLKHGDYCSGWMKSWVAMDKHVKYPTQQEWDDFQEQMERERELKRCVSEVVESH